MYLLVFITLVISLIGIYAQVLTLQASRLAQGQTAVAQEMLRWHSTAVAQARYTQLTAAIAGGCDLTAAGAIGTPCMGSGGAVTIGLGGGWAPACPQAALPCWTALPSDYQTTPYTFYSVYYKPAGSYPAYVMTFVQPPTAAVPGFVTLPGPAGNQIGVTMSNLETQLKNNSLEHVSYGSFSGGNLVTPPISNNSAVAPASLDYPLPTTLTTAAYNGSIGIISVP